MVVGKVKHLVPLIKGVGNNVEIMTGLQPTLQKVRNHLRLEYPSKFSEPNNNVLEFDTLEFKPTLKLNNEVSIKQLPKFKFKAQDYKFTQDEMKNAPYLFPDSKFPIVSKDTPICTDYTQVKGPNNDLYAIAILRGTTKKKALHTCKWFIFHYWDTSSYFANIIKSKPGVMIICHNFNLFNINKKITGDIPSQMQNTAYPFKYAVYRTRVKKLLRKNFMDLYWKDKQFAEKYCGFYKFSVSVYPETKEDVTNFIENLQICLDKISKFDANALKEESKKELLKIPWNEVDKILKRNHVKNFAFQHIIDKKRDKRTKKRL